MKNKLNKIALLAMLCISPTFASELSDFDEIRSVVLKGNSIHIVTDFAKCEAEFEKAKPLTIKGAFKPDTVMISQDNILSSFTHFTLNNPHFPEKPVYEFVVYQITKENKVNITSQVLDATNYKPLRKKSTFTCKISEGTKIFD